MDADDKTVRVPFGDDMTPEQRVCRMLEIIEDLLPIALLPQTEFNRADNREEAAAYAAALGRCSTKLPREFRAAHAGIDWTAVDDWRDTGFHDGIDALILRDQFQDRLPALRKGLRAILAGPASLP